MTKVHDNDIVFEGQSGIGKMNFQFIGDYCVSDNEPFDGVKVSTGETLTITVKAGRHNSSRCASFFSSAVNGNQSHMMHSRGGDNKPKELNFAVKGTLKINDKEYDVVLGQGHHGNNNNWHIASFKLTADKDGKSGNLGAFRITQSDDSYTFKVYPVEA